MANWTEKDIKLLNKAVNKYPPGTKRRIEKISALLDYKFTEE